MLDIQRIVICAGRPRCDFNVAAVTPREADRQMKTCMWCTRVTVLPDGSEHIESRPGNA